ncbi:MAG: TerB family tellurite resistance protein [Candidatus Pelagibacterales bacterium]|nr:MAG: TerB family tellurite resistance protein [Pelagibacterales bacterium]
MFKKIFNIKKREVSDNKNVLIASLLIHAARIDENYTDVEKKIIKKALMEINTINSDEAENLIKLAAKKEEESNQIVEFTQEIKKYSMEYRLKIIEVIWKIVYSDGLTNEYESNLIRRICGLLYISGKDSGVIKIKVQNLLNKK